MTAGGLSQEANELAAALLDLPEETLLEVLGLQLLAVEPPARAVGVATYLGNAAVLAEFAQKTKMTASEALFPSSIAGLGEILRQTRDRGRRYVEEAAPRLRDALCREGRLRRELQERIDGGELVVRIVAEIAMVVLQLPALLGSLGITVAAWLCKRGLDRFCVDTKSVEVE